MSIAQINIKQIRLGPEIPLGRRGCEIESSLDIGNTSGWADTIFKGMIDSKRAEVIKKLKEYGEHIYSVLRKIHSSTLKVLMPLLKQMTVMRSRAI